MLLISGELGNASVNIKRPLGAQKWSGSGVVGGAIGIQIIARIYADGKFVAI